MGSIDVPQFMRDKMKKSLTTETKSGGENAIDIPDFIKKKGSTEADGVDLNNGTSKTSPSSSPLPLPSKNQSEEGFKYDRNPFGVDEVVENRPIVSVSGIKIPYDTPIPNDNKNSLILAKELQERINSKTYSNDDVNTIAKAKDWSIPAAKAYMDGNIGTGTVINFNDAKNKQKEQLGLLVAKANRDLGINDDYNQVLATPELAGAYINKIEKLYDDKSASQKKVVVDKELSAKRGGSTASAFSTLGAAGKIDVDTEKNESINKNAAQQIKGIVGDNIIEQIKDDPTLSYDQKVRKIYSLSDSKEQKNVSKSIADIQAPVLPQDPLFNLLNKGDDEKIDLLNSSKAAIEYKLNQSLKQKMDYNNALKTSIIEEYNSKASQGKVPDEDIVNYKKRIDDIESENASIGKEYVTDKELEKKYPVLFKGQLVNKINEFNAIRSGNVKGYQDDNYSGLDIFDFLKNNGYDINDQRVADVIASSDFKDYNFFGNPTKNALDVFTNSAKSIGDVTGIRTEADISADKIHDQLYPTQVGDKEEYKLTDKAKLFQNIGNTTGQLLGQGLMQTATMGAGRMAGLTRLGAEKGAFWLSGALPSYDQAYKDAGDFIDNKAGKMAYAGLIAWSNSASEGIFDDSKIFKIAGVNDIIADISKRVGEKGFTEEIAKNLLDKAKNKVLEYGKHVGINVGQETFEEVVTQNFEDALRYISGDPNANMANAIENATNTAIQTATGMSAIGLVGGYKDMKREKNVSPRMTIYNAALYHDQAIDAINKGFEQKLYDNDERNEKIQTINTAKDAIGILNTTEKVTGVKLGRNEKAVYVANLTAEALLTKQLKDINTKEGVVDTLLRSNVEERISNLQNQRNQLLKGDVSIDDDGSIIDNIKNKTNEKDTNKSDQAGEPGQTSKSSETDQVVKADKADETNPVLSDFVDKISSGEKLTSPEDLQFYENNKTEIEAELKKRTDASLTQKQKPKRNATTITQEGQQQADNTASGEQKHTSVDEGQQQQTGEQAAQQTADISNQPVGSEQKPTTKKELVETVKGLSKNLINDNFSDEENFKFLKDQSISAPASLNNSLKGNEELTTDLIATNGKADIEKAIEYQQERLKGENVSATEIEEVDKHIQLLEKGLEKRNNKPKVKVNAIVETVNTPSTEQQPSNQKIKSSWESNIEALVHPETGLAAVTKKILEEQQPLKDVFLKRNGLTVEDYRKLSDAEKEDIQQKWVKSDEFKTLGKQQPSNLDRGSSNSKGDVITFENAKEGDLINHNGQNVEVVGRGKSRGGTDIVEVKKAKRSKSEIREAAIQNVVNRKLHEYNGRKVSMEQFNQDFAPEIRDEIEKETALSNSATSTYTIDAEQWNNEVKTSDKQQPSNVGNDNEGDNKVLNEKADIGELDFIKNDDLPKEEVDVMRNGKIIGAKKVTNQEHLDRQNKIREDFEKLKKLLDCLTGKKG